MTEKDEVDPVRAMKEGVGRSGNRSSHYIWKLDGSRQRPASAALLSAPGTH
jgi:hypothetical protein